MVMGDDRISLGSPREQRFADIWASAPYQEFRAALAGTEPPEVCRGCALYHGSF